MDDKQLVSMRLKCALEATELPPVKDPLALLTSALPTSYSSTIAIETGPEGPELEGTACLISSSVR